MKYYYSINFAGCGGRYLEYVGYGESFYALFALFIIDNVSVLPAMH